MAKTVVGLFDNFNEAQMAVRDLVDAGFNRDNISLIANDADGKYKTYNDSGSATANAAGDGAVGGSVVGGIFGLLVGIGMLAVPGVGPVLAAGPIATAIGTTALGAGVGAAAGGLLGALVGLGIPEQEAGYYAEGVRRGGTLVSLTTTDTNAPRAVEILNNHGAVDIDRRADYYRQGGYTTFDTKAKPFTGDEITTYRESNPNTYATAQKRTGTMTDTNEVTVPEVEEEIQVGKRAVERGGVRIYTTVHETPIEEQVTLREEHVNVERRAADRPATAADMNPLQGGKLEVTEHAEEAVVNKESRVVGEVVVSKDVDQHTETVRDTVRKTEVEVEKVAGDTTRTTPR